MAQSLQIFRLFRIKTNELLRDSLDFLVERFKQSRKIFTVASPFGQVLFVLENLAQLIFYYIEDSITELNIIQATRNSSVYGIASVSGYKPSRSVASSGEITIYPNASELENILGNNVIIPNYTKIKCLNNGLNYVMVLPQDELRLSTADKNKKTTISIMQGGMETQSFTGKGNAFESISLQYPRNFFIDNFFVNVYVNDVKWQVYDNLLRIPRGAIGCIIKTGSNSGVDIYFGNGMFGRYPNLGDEIKVEYLVTDGWGGNIIVDDPNQVKFEFSETGFNVLGEEVNLNNIFNINTTVSPDFGSNPEPIALTRLMLSKSEAGLITLPSYELLLRRMQMFSIIKVSRDDKDERMVNLFIIPDVNRLIRKNDNYFTIPEDRFVLSNAIKNSLLQYIEKSGTKLIATDVKIVDPIISKYVLNISIVAYDHIPGDMIKNDIVNVLSDYFLNINRRDRIPKSDLVRIIEGVEGVDSVNVRIVCKKNEAGKMLDPNAVNIGVDNFNDIIIDKNELPVIRGGWNDRSGNEYAVGISEEGLGAVNIAIKDIISKPKS